MKEHSGSTPKPRPNLKRLVRGALTTVVAGALAWLAVSGGPTVAADGVGASTETVADAAPGYAVEDFAYPQADEILAERGITLKRGDGHIVLAECDSQTGLLSLWARGGGEICFRVTGNSGYLSLEIPAVYGVLGNDYTTELSMTVDDEEKTYDIPKNEFTAVGETTDPEQRDHTLVEIRATK
ncbi:hypothetical protein ACFXAZ_21720 [Streptomyces sp. NPDC059477]|uniref:hypothetical protein n=1 Tax=Streptomyces sp. NPDC059477 TaxID=3346847 RepID=UPI0036867F26